MTRIEIPDPFAALEPLEARLVVDTIGPRPAGLRGDQVTSRHLLFEVGSFYIDLLQDLDAGSDEAIVMGQLASRGEANPHLHGAPVVLHRGGTRLGGTFCSPRGEFVFRLRPQPQVRLKIKVGKSHFVELPLDPPRTGES